MAVRRIRAAVASKRRLPSIAKPARIALLRACCILLLIGSAQVVREASAQEWVFVDVIALNDLEFGTVVSGAGELEVTKTDPNVARFKVLAKLPGSHRSVRIHLESLGPLEGVKGDGVPHTVRAAFNSTGDNQTTATDIAGDWADIRLDIDEGKQGPGPRVYSAYVYVYGTASVGLQRPGRYQGGVRLNAEVLWSSFDSDDEDDWAMQSLNEESANAAGERMSDDAGL